MTTRFQNLLLLSASSKYKDTANCKYLATCVFDTRSMWTSRQNPSNTSNLGGWRGIGDHSRMNEFRGAQAALSLRSRATGNSRCIYIIAQVCKYPCSQNRLALEITEEESDAQTTMCAGHSRRRKSQQTERTRTATEQPRRRKHGAEEPRNKTSFLKMTPKLVPSRYEHDTTESVKENADRHCNRAHHQVRLLKNCTCAPPKTCGKRTLQHLASDSAQPRWAQSKILLMSARFEASCQGALPNHHFGFC